MLNLTFVNKDSGPKGQKGQDGPKGQKGQDGTKGTDGPKGQKGQDGTKGQKGQDGTKGQKGEPGPTGAKGTTGDKGQKGQTGPKGEKGEKGTFGVKGAIGPKGPKGQKGDDSSVAGPKGQKGEIGPKGQKGEIGPKGTTGSKGNIGAKGPEGNFGGASFDFTFDANSAAASDPGTGIVRLNSLSGAAAGQKGATAMYIDATDDDGNSINSFMETIRDASSTVKGYVRISEKFNTSDFLLFQISDAEAQDTNTWWIVSVANTAFPMTTAQADAVGDGLTVGQEQRLGNGTSSHFGSLGKMR